MAKINKVLVGSVALVGMISSGAYIFHFWDLPISNNSSDWAHFATYISGTVGVSAVVATLVAFVKTLSQQQKLIESQDEMLEEQKRQIDLAEVQNRDLKRKHEVDIAYTNAKELFPDYCSSFERSLSETVPPYLNHQSMVSAFEVLEFSHQINRAIMINNPGKLHDLFDLANRDDMDDYLDRIFLQIGRLYKFMSAQIESAPDLLDYFDNYLISSGNNINKKFYFHCYHAYLIGRGYEEVLSQGVRFLGLPASYDGSNESLSLWVEFGRKMKQ